MTWHVPMALVVFFGYIVHPYINKKIANDEKFRVAKLALYAAFAFVMSLILFGLGKLFGLVEGVIVLRGDLLIFLVISLFNPVANYFHWSALKTHQSLTSVFTWMDDLIAITLGYFVLSEGRFLNPQIILGIAMVFLSVVIFSSFKGSLRGISKRELTSLIVSVAKYSVIWGMVFFFMRFFALRGMRWFEWVPIWYFGSFLGAVTLFLFSDKETRGSAADLKPYLPVCFCFGLSALVCMLFTFWMRSLPDSPIMITQPILQVSEMILPTMVGLYIFHEKETFSWLGWLAMAIGLAGGLIITFSF